MKTTKSIELRKFISSKSAQDVVFKATSWALETEFKIGKDRWNKVESENELKIDLS